MSHQAQTQPRSQHQPDNEALPLPYPDAERRVMKLEMRAAEPANEQSRRVEGYAAVFNKKSEGLWFDEYIMPGAFRDALLTSDVRCLQNHSDNKVLGRTSAGTLELREDGTGLWFGVDIPETSFGNDLLVSMRRGDIKECSFMFTVESAEWTFAEGNENDIRRITKVKRLYDVSIVTFPAYPDATAAARSRDAALKDKTHQTTPADETFLALAQML